MSCTGCAMTPIHENITSVCSGLMHSTVLLTLTIHYRTCLCTGVGNKWTIIGAWILTIAVAIFYTVVTERIPVYPNTVACFMNPKDRNLQVFNFNFFFCSACMDFVAQLVERIVRTSMIVGSNPIKDNFFTSCLVVALQRLNKSMV